MHPQTCTRKLWLSPTRRVLLLRAMLLVALAVAVWIIAPTARVAAQEPDWQDHYPVTNTITASPVTTISITYDQAMDASTVTSHTFAVHGMQSGLVTETHGVIDGNRLIVTPTNGFHQGELVYAIATTRTESIAGSAPLSATQWQFNAGVVRDRCVAGFVADTAASANLTGAREGSVAWGDYDNDGDLDILLTGRDTNLDGIALVYQNQDGVFGEDTAASANLTGVYYSSVAWGDYDGDGDLDILLTGYDSGGGFNALIYENQDGIFGEDSAASANLTNVLYGSVAWGDYDNDGDLDILLTGQDNGAQRLALVYENQDGVFSVNSAASANLTGVGNSSVAWGDYDDDGDLDILLTGIGSNGYNALVYENQSGVFITDTAASANLTGVVYSSVAWGDYDGDGDLDILLTGYDSGGGYNALVYKNQDGIFSEDSAASANLTGVREGSVAWGDYDNDGDLDILLTGRDASFGIHALVYANQGGVFGEDAAASANLNGVYYSSVAWGDYDDDGDLDILLTGWDSGGGYNALVYRNDDCADLVIAKSATSAAAPGQPISYILAFSNAGTGAATGVAITDTIPASVTGVSAISSGIVITQRVSTRYAWDVADLAPGAGGIITITGTLSDVLPVGIFSNTATITATTKDSSVDNNSSDAGTEVQNAAPVADDDSYSVDEDSSHNPLDVLDGDTDANGHTLAISSVGTPNNGGTVVNGGTVITYTPLADFFGDEVFVYTVGDGNGGFDTATVTVTVSNVSDPPVADAGDDQSVVIGEVVTLDGSGSHDPDGDDLVYAWAQMGGPEVMFTPNLSITTLTAPTSTTVLTFTLTVTDTPAGTLGLPSVPDTVVITVAEGNFYIYLPLILKNQ